MIWNEQIEYLPPEKMERLQSERLRKLVKYVLNNSIFYRNLFKEAGISARDIKHISDLKKLPFTRKADLRDNYPFQMFCVPLREVVEIHASSGTTGNPTVVAYTKNDIKLWSEVMARTLAIAGATPDDIVQNAYGYGLFTGGLGVHYGALELGASVIPMSSGGTKRQLKIMRDFKSTVLTCTPSYALFMAEEAREMDINPRESSLRIGVLGAEPWSDGLRREIEAAWGMTALDVYGLSEIIGPGVAQECPEKTGLHIYSDVFFPEVIDPETGEPVEEGEDGELVITTLTKEAIPLIRYRIGDIVNINYERCSCGRTLPRISKIKGRTDDMLIIRGINVFPSQIESVLLEVEGAQPHYLLVVDRVKGLDTLEIQVEVGEEVFSDEIRKLQQLSEKIKKEIESVLALSVEVKLVEPKTIERSMGKAKRVIDKRKK
ncbi:MAG: phenylacetate--CoA ligase [Candidatus Euphemobacter frigidus]|nr:phenylacetate--CoA ligase [Candidatus Euphemobacter frigidus]MDP8275690.1 phenylacetate--CoA ligase [Candidatus Euphemobacter frigidus]